MKLNVKADFDAILDLSTSDGECMRSGLSNKLISRPLVLMKNSATISCLTENILRYRLWTNVKESDVAMHQEP